LYTLGIIQRQSIKGTIYSYLGVAIGFITTGLLFPRFLTTEQVGLLSLLVSYSNLFAILAILGFDSVTLRLFPYFRDDKTNHHGFLALSIGVSLAGFFLSIGIFYLLKPLIIRDSIEQSKLFVDYLYFIPPLIFFVLIFNTIDTYNRVMLNASFGTFLKDLFQRVFILCSICLLLINLADFNKFVLFYVVSLCIPGILIFYPIVQKKQFSLKTDLSFIDKSLVRNMMSVSLFGILGGFSNVIIQKVDTIMINSMIDLSSTGIYTISFFFGSLVSIPARSVQRISTGIVAEAWKNNNIDDIRIVYYKSCLNLFILGILIFIGIWGNIHNVFKILPEEYLPGKYVIFFFGISACITMMGGISSIIINLSKYYRYQTYFIIMFGITIVVTNLILIPRFGIVGASIAALVSTVFYRLIQFLFIYYKFRISPYDYKFLLIIVFAGITYILNLIVPVLNNFILDILIRSLFMTLIFGTLIVISKISTEVETQKIKSLNFLKKIITKK
jgi:O-antigen/teichoic acid export membrane protein